LLGAETSAYLRQVSALPHLAARNRQEHRRFASGRSERRGWHASLCGALLAVAALAGCGRTSPPPLQNSKPTEIALPVPSSSPGELTEPAAALDASAPVRCEKEVVLTAAVEGFHTYSSRSLGFPTLFVDFDVLTGGRVWKGYRPVEVYLSGLVFAGEFEPAERCSVEEVSPSHVRITCFSSKLRSVELRVEARREVVAIIDGKEFQRATPRDPTACVSLATDGLVKRDLDPLIRAYMNDQPSPRCANTTGGRRKVVAKVVRLPGADSHECELRSYNHKGRSFYSGPVRLVIPSLGISQEIGELSIQCSMCKAIRHAHARGVSLRCYDDSFSAVYVYQLGDDAYYVHRDERDGSDFERTRRIPLPCGIGLDFQVDLDPKNVEVGEW
jgi:hypothetical protein